MAQIDLRLIFVGVTSTLLIGSIGCRAEVPASPTNLAHTPPRVESNIELGTSSPAENKTSAASFEIEPDFTLLKREQFDAFGAEPETWSRTDEGFACTGKPRGYLYSKVSYSNFTLKVDYRFAKPANLKDESKFKGNTGFLMYITGDHKLWPASIEVQGKHAQIASIKENGGTAPVEAKDDENARQLARKPVGEWNELEIVSKDGNLRVSLNGKLISESKAGQLNEGLIGIQSEDYPFEVRHMRIRTE